MVTYMGSGRPLDACKENHLKALQYDRITEGGIESDLSESLDQLDKVNFGVAMCNIFHARIIPRCFNVTSAQQADSDVYKEAFDQAVTLVTDASIHLDSRRWLTFQYELGYTNLDIGAAQEGKTWLETFIKSLDYFEQTSSKLTKHWKKMRQNAKTKLPMVPLLKAAQQSGLSL
jgi:hypothetical protein